MLIVGEGQTNGFVSSKPSRSPTPNRQFKKKFWSNGAACAEIRYVWPNSKEYLSVARRSQALHQSERGLQGNKRHGVMEVASQLSLI